ncbi:hypothetical protein BX666DRAFT_1362238 [Dichotomocladium elegans]|nr:hypothetical protein BX666DRAFT_1362238 [Dichotomocladium elegans]
MFKGGHLWLMHTQPLPYSVFTPDTQEIGQFLPFNQCHHQQHQHQQQQQLPVMQFMGSSSTVLPIVTSTPFPMRHTRIMTAPPTYPSWEPCINNGNNTPQPRWINLMEAPASGYALPYAAVAPSPLRSLPPASIMIANRKRGRKDHDDDDAVPLPVVPLPSSAYKRREIHSPLYVRTSSGDNRPIDLREWTVDELKAKLCDILSVASEKITDVVWRRRDEATSSDIFILVDEGVIAHHLSSGLTVTVEYEAMQDGSGRLVLNDQ